MKSQPSHDTGVHKARTPNAHRELKPSPACTPGRQRRGSTRPLEDNSSRLDCTAPSLLYLLPSIISPAFFKLLPEQSSEKHDLIPSPHFPPWMDLLLSPGKRPTLLHRDRPSQLAPHCHCPTPPSETHLKYASSAGRPPPPPSAGSRSLPGTILKSLLRRLLYSPP